MFKSSLMKLLLDMQIPAEYMILIVTNLIFNLNKTPLLLKTLDLFPPNSRSRFRTSERDFIKAPTNMATLIYFDSSRLSSLRHRNYVLYAQKKVFRFERALIITFHAISMAASNFFSAWFSTEAQYNANQSLMKKNEFIK